MQAHQIAAQLFSCRETLKTPEDIAATLTRLADNGFKAVQISGMGPIAQADLVALCKERGLTICATHEPALTILNETQTSIDRLKALECQYTAYPHPKDVDVHDEAQVHQLAADLEAAAQAFKAAGLGLAYHNHANEFVTHNGKTVLDIIYDEAPTLIGEIDTHWVQAGGANPTTWCTKLAGRMPIVHLKDFAIAGHNERVFAVVGEGNLEWHSIIPALEAGGTEWYIIEQDNCYGEDPVDCLTRSRNFLVENFCK